MTKKRKSPSSTRRTEAVRRREAHWRSVFERQRASGLCQTEFCRQESIPPHRYFWWKRELRLRGEKSPPPAPTRKKRPSKKSQEAALVRVRLSDEPRSSAAFELVLSGERRLRVPPDFDATALRRLLDVLEGGGGC